MLKFQPIVRDVGSLVHENLRFRISGLVQTWNFFRSGPEFSNQRNPNIWFPSHVTSIRWWTHQYFDQKPVGLFHVHPRFKSSLQLPMCLLAGCSYSNSFFFFFSCFTFWDLSFYLFSKYFIMLFALNLDKLDSDFTVL